MKQIHAYQIDLTRIEGSGDFPCPRCGTTLSPDDETEETYTILGSRVNDDGLEEIAIQCNRCSSHIHLTGFAMLQKIKATENETEERTKKRAIMLCCPRIVMGRTR